MSQEGNGGKGMRKERRMGAGPTWIFCLGAPEFLVTPLQLVATRVLAQTVSASACERNGPHLTLFTLKRGIDNQATRYIIIIVPLVGLSLLALVAYLLQYSFVAFCFCFIKRV